MVPLARTHKVPGCVQCFCVDVSDLCADSYRHEELFGCFLKIDVGYHRAGINVQVARASAEKCVLQ
jgi:hypothetical protein